MRLRLVEQTRGYELRSDEGNYQVATLSMMDAAELLFQMKDELRRREITRGCIDRVHARRRKVAA